MLQTLNIEDLNTPRLNDASGFGRALEVKDIKSNRRYADGSFYTYKGYFVEAFGFGNVPLYVYRNVTLSRFDVYSKKGNPIAQSSKTIHHAKQGARLQLKSISARNRARSSARKAATAAVQPVLAA